MKIKIFVGNSASLSEPFLPQRVTEASHFPLLLVQQGNQDSKQVSNPLGSA